MRIRLLWQLFPTFLLVSILSIFAIELITWKALKDFYYESLANDLEARAHLVDHLDLFSRVGPHEADTLCKTLSKSIDTRITLVRPNGVVIADSDKNPASMNNHGKRPEIRQALAGMVGISTRYSQTLDREMLYVALASFKGGNLQGVVRVSMPTAEIWHTLSRINWQLIRGGFVVAIIAALLSLYVSHRISKPIQWMKQGVQHFASGNLGYRIPSFRTIEFNALSQKMNEMASQLDDRIRTITKQRNELEAVLSSMVEVVFAVDLEGRIIMYNHAAETLFGIDRETAQSLRIEEITSNTDLQDFIKDTLQDEGVHEGELSIVRDDSRYLQLTGTAIHDSVGKKTGALVVLNDITKIKRLERVRRDFVANVSHELKTPITSIKGFVETLKDGALDDEENARRFLNIIERQTNGLSAIIEDLLTLSRIESDSEKESLRTSRSPMADIIEEAVLICNRKAKLKNIRILAEVPKDVSANVNGALIAQAVINLLDNAIKYSGENSDVQVRVEKTESMVAIRVEDSGPGIGKEHLPRLFERFYRVDKARSRSMGGTGLGLAIVKHIAQAHNGKIAIESELGRGSVFSIELPVQEEEVEEG